MDGLSLAGLVDAGTTGVLVAVIVVLIRRERPVQTVDNSVERWISRLETAFDEAQRRELLREQLDAEHRAWDQGVLLAVALGTSDDDIRRRVEALGAPPPLAPLPTQWLGVDERHEARRRAAPLAPQT